LSGLVKSWELFLKYGSAGFCQLTAVNRKAGVAAEDGEQYGDAFVVAAFVQNYRLQALHRTVGNLYAFTGSEGRSDCGKMAFICPGPQIVDELVTNHGGLRTEAHEIDDVMRVAYGAITAGKVNAAKKIAWKEWFGYLAADTTNRPLQPNLRKIDFEPQQRFKLLGDLLFPLRLGEYAIPVHERWG